MTGFASSIPRRMLAALLSIYLATYFATAVVVYSGVRASLLETDATALHQLAGLKYQQLGRLIDTLSTDLTVWSELEVMNDLVSGDIDKRVAQALESIKRVYRLPGEIYGFDAGGILLASSRRVNAGETLPERWRSGERGLVLFDKEADPMTGGQVVALEIPVFGTFDKSFRAGTLVMTYPWSAIEAQLFDSGGGTLLREVGERIRVLAADPPDLAARTALDRDAAAAEGVAGDFVIGRSAPRPGLIGDWQVVTVHDTAEATQPLRLVTLELVLLGAALALPIVLLGRWLSRRLTAPIADLTRVVRQIADTERLDVRVPVTANDELGSLATSFNRMTDSLARVTRERERFMGDLAALNQSLEGKVAERTAALEQAVQQQRRLIGDISHEIKSPLARLSMALGLARRTAATGAERQFDRIEREIYNISALAGELLTLARLDGSAPPPAFVAVDLAALLGGIVDDARYEAPARSADLIWRCAEGLAVDGDPELLRRAVENVVRNALFYTTPGTPVEIAASARGDRAILTVADQGPGVPDETLDHLFEPFYRVDQARSRDTGGTGIGLTICERVVNLHGGTVRARRNTPCGLVIEIDLPAVAGR